MMQPEHSMSGLQLNQRGLALMEDTGAPGQQLILMELVNLATWV
jgi:hypothetical protein